MNVPPTWGNAGQGNFKNGRILGAVGSPRHPGSTLGGSPGEGCWFSMILCSIFGGIRGLFGTLGEPRGPQGGRGENYKNYPPWGPPNNRRSDCLNSRRSDSLREVVQTPHAKLCGHAVHGIFDRTVKKSDFFLNGPEKSEHKKCRKREMWDTFRISSNIFMSF